jgi:phosphoglycerate dehydrogenase-like enzyme
MVSSKTVSSKASPVILLVLRDFFVLIACVLYEYLLAIGRLFVPANRKSICGELVVITGAGQGLGREVAKQLAALGAKLALLDINQVGSFDTRLLSPHSLERRLFVLVHTRKERFERNEKRASKSISLESSGMFYV